MNGFPRHPLTDGMAWSGFDRAVARVPGGARAVFQAIGVPLGIVDRPGMSVSFRQYVAYFEVAARLGQDLDFGHRFGMRTRAEQSGIPGHLVLNARRFRDAILDLARTLPTLVQGLRPELVEDRDPPALMWSIAPGVGPAPQFMRFVNAYLVRMLQAHRGPRWHPVRVMYAAPPPSRPAVYASHLGCPVVFDAPVSLVEIAPSCLGQEKASVDRHVYTLLTKYADVLLARTPTRRDVRAAVGVAIRDGLALSRHDLTFVTQRLHMSPRVLQRRIAAYGTSFRALRDEVRFELARSLVVHGDAPIGEIATKLGYAEVAAFSRAFTRRFGQSPRTARHAARARPRGRTATVTR